MCNDRFFKDITTPINKYKPRNAIFAEQVYGRFLSQLFRLLDKFMFVKSNYNALEDKKVQSNSNSMHEIFTKKFLSLGSYSNDTQAGEKHSERQLNCAAKFPRVVNLLCALVYVKREKQELDICFQNRLP